MKLGLADAVCVVIAYLAGLRYGAEGIAVTFLIEKVLICVPMMYATFKDTPVTVRDVVEAIRAPIIAVGLAAAAGLTAKLLFARSVAEWIVAVGGCSLMLLAYALILLFVLGKWNFYRDIVSELIPRRKS